MKKIEQLEADLTQALKDKNDLVVLTLRQIKTALTNAEIANKRQALDEAAIHKLLKSEVKKRREAADLYRQGNRAELADKEEKEIEIISEYLPPEIGPDAIRAAVKLTIERLGATGPQAMGQVMGAVMQELKGQADGTAVRQIVSEELGQ